MSEPKSEPLDGFVQIGNLAIPLSFESKADAFDFLNTIGSIAKPKSIETSGATEPEAKPARSRRRPGPKPGTKRRGRPPGRKVSPKADDPAASE